MCAVDRKQRLSKCLNTKEIHIALHWLVSGLRMIPSNFSIRFCLRTLVTVVCLSNALYQVWQSMRAYIGKPTSTSYEKGSLKGALPLLWVCRNPGINISRMQELGYATLEDLRLGRWNGEGYLDWSANNSIGIEQLYNQVTRFEGRSLLEGDIVANSESEGFVFKAVPVCPFFNIDFGECVNLVSLGPWFVNGKRKALRENQPVVLVLDFKNLEGTFSILVTDQQRMKYEPNMRTSTTPFLTVTSFANYNYNYHIHVTETVMQEKDVKAECKAYGKGYEFETLHDCYQKEQEKFFLKKLSCVPPQFAENTSLMCQGKLDQVLFDKELRDYF